MLSDAWRTSCSTAPCCTSRARAVSARRPSPRRSGWRPRRAGGGRSSARSPSRTASRAPSPATACGASRRSSWPRTCGRSGSTRPRRCRSGSGASSAGTALRLITGSSAFQHFVAAAPGAKELITIAKVWELAQVERWDAANRTYDLVIVDAPSSGHGLAMLTAPSTFGEIARVGPIRRQAFKIRDMLADPRAPATSRSRCPRRCRSTRRSSSATRLHDAIGLGLDAIVVNGVYPARFNGKEAEALRAAAANGLEPGRAGGRSRRAVRARARADAARARAPAQARGRRAGAHAAVPVRRRGRAGGVRDAGGEARARSGVGGRPKSTAAVRGWRSQPDRARTSVHRGYAGADDVRAIEPPPPPDPPLHLAQLTLRTRVT